MTAPGSQARAPIRRAYRRFPDSASEVRVSWPADVGLLRSLFPTGQASPGLTGVGLPLITGCGERGSGPDRDGRGICGGVGAGSAAARARVR